MDIKGKILEVLKLTRNTALSSEKIYNKVYSGFKSDETLELFRSSMCELLEEKKICCIDSKKDLYLLSPFKKGIFHVRKNGICYVLADNDLIYIPKNKVFNCLDGDTVLVRITNFNTMEGIIKEIIDRKGIIGEVKTIKNNRFVICNNTMYLTDVDKSIVDGMLVGIKIDKVKTGKYYHAKIDKIIGHKNAPKLDERKLFYEFDVPDTFNPLQEEELKSIPNEVLEDSIKNRVDLRNEEIFTIDGDDTKDIDDAVSLKILENGNYLLGVHIADVTHYIKENSIIDQDAYLKGTSFYTPGVVNPMYDPKLSNGICSLNPNVDRLAISCLMEIDFKGNTVNFDIFESVINSSMQMTYNNVNKILNENIVPKGYEKFSETLKKMKKLSDILDSMRKKRGALEFDSSELKINVDSKGNVIDIKLRSQSAGENLIEMFMLEANEVVATYLYNLDIPSIYRVHDYPNLERLTKTISIINNYGYKIIDKINIKDPYFLQKILNNIKENKNYDIYSSMILRCMAKASYKVENTGHFGIGINSLKKEAYTHFTSPIRRYPDTTVHRILKKVLKGDIESLKDYQYKEKLKEIAIHSSSMELISDKVEKEAEKMKMAAYINNYIGSIFDGRIVSFTKYGMYVRLSNYVEGRVSYNLMDDYYFYDENLEMLIGERTKKIYRLGDKIKIEVIRASKELREIDFKPVMSRTVKSSKNGLSNTKTKSKLRKTK